MAFIRRPKYFVCEFNEILMFMANWNLTPSNSLSGNINLDIEEKKRKNYNKITRSICHRNVVSTTFRMTERVLRTSSIVAKYDKVIFLRNHSSSITHVARQTRGCYFPRRRDNTFNDNIGIMNESLNREEG